MSFNIRFDGAEEMKKHLDKLVEQCDRASKKIHDNMIKKFYDDLVRGKKIEFSMTLGCYAVDPDFIIWMMNNSSEFDYNFPKKTINKNLKKSLR